MLANARNLANFMRRYNARLSVRRGAFGPRASFSHPADTQQWDKETMGRIITMDMVDDLINSGEIVRVSSSRGFFGEPIDVYKAV